MHRVQNLINAKKYKNDEFYTLYEDIEKEIEYYTKELKNKVVYCNCDDYTKSNFVKYFKDNFYKLGLKELISSSYKNRKIFIKDKKTEVITFIPKEKEFEDIKYEYGDFRSSYCVNLLKRTDIVITNPPFSLFREYVSQLVKYNKKFLILGNMNALTYKEIFPLIKNNKMWTGYKCFGGGMNMIACPRNFDKSKVKKYTIDDEGNFIVNIMGVIWFTNLDIYKRKEELDLYCKYDPEIYPKYDNYDAINVDKTVEIPGDYEGVMGVPISFIDKYNPDQFEILGMTASFDESPEIKEIKTSLKFRHGPIVNGKEKYRRILIKNKKPSSEL